MEQIISKSLNENDNIIGKLDKKQFQRHCYTIKSTLWVNSQKRNLFQVKNKFWFSFKSRLTDLYSSFQVKDIESQIISNLQGLKVAGEEEIILESL